MLFDGLKIGPNVLHDPIFLLHLEASFQLVLEHGQFWFHCWVAGFCIDLSLSGSFCRVFLKSCCRKMASTSVEVDMEKFNGNNFEL